VTLFLLCLSWAASFLAGFYARDLHLRGHTMPSRLTQLSEVSTTVKIGGVVTALMLAVTVLSGVSWIRAADAIRQNQATAVCQTRAAADGLVLWEGLKKQLSAPRTDESPKAQKARARVFFASLDDYIASLKLLIRARQSADPEKVCEEHQP